MTGIDRRKAIAAYKERKSVAGIYAIRCAATGEVWVGASRHLDTQRNGIWFALRQGSGRNPLLQAAWRAHGEATFIFEALERFEEEETAYVLQAALKERLAHWRLALDARLA